MNPDATIRIRLLTTEQGGRLGAIQGPRYGCPVMIDEQGFDCRFVLEEAERLELGCTYDVGVKFLNPDSALRALEVGKTVSFWEGKTIATGEVVSISSA